MILHLFNDDNFIDGAIKLFFKTENKAYP